MGKTLWYVYISGQGFNPVHGKVHAETKKEAMEKMKTMAEEERYAIQAKETWSEAKVLLRGNKAWVYRNECTEYGCEENVVISYRVGYEKIPC